MSIPPLTLREAAKKALYALERIAAIENQPYGTDWAEIESARAIANEAIPALRIHMEEEKLKPLNGMTLEAALAWVESLK